jgi:ABC-2 type transport system ATP-binding protein
MRPTESSSAKPSEPTLEILSVGFRYGPKVALDDFSLQVAKGEIFSLLGPNGSGKTTLFRLISTLLPLQQGEINVCGHSMRSDRHNVRRALGIVFQSPSLDRKLTVLENIRCQAALYGLSGAARDARIAEVIQQVGISDRANDLVEKLSGGLKRRVEIAKGILHRPRLMLLDEPSTGLDPAARLDLWHALESLRDNHDVTVLMTTHLLEEAEKSDRIAILHQGKAVAIGAPAQMRRQLGDQVLTIQSEVPEEIVSWLATRFIVAQRIEGQLRVSMANAAQWVAPLSTQFGDRIQCLTVGQPSLEDVFVAKTGHRFW